MPNSTEGLDLERYLMRIGYEGPLDASLETLRGLHYRHVRSIPFENLDVQLGRPILLDLASLQAKLVAAERGGYCFEQNTLFAAVLRHLGFRVTPLSARVRSLAAAVTPRTHMMLRVELPEGAFLVDVGFGGDSPTGPIRFAPGTPQLLPLDTFRLMEEGSALRLDVRRDGEFLPLYAFTLEEQLPVDYELANYYTSTHPSSRFVQTLVAARVGDDCRYLLRDRDFGVRRGDQVERRNVETDTELFGLLERHFGLRIDPRARFFALHGRPR